jgi:hypothetical protein
MLIISTAISELLQKELTSDEKVLAEQTLNKINKHINARSFFSQIPIKEIETI